MCKWCKECKQYRPDCRLYGYFDEKGKPHVDKVVVCENHGCAECKKEED